METKPMNPSLGLADIPPGYLNI
ncbi:MAG: hypothetical protein RLZZ203_456, partial [Cyanobacteriota bacterium]